MGLRVVFCSVEVRFTGCFLAVPSVLRLVLLTVQFLLESCWHRLADQIELFPETSQLWAFEYARVVDLLVRCFVDAGLFGPCAWRDAEKMLSTMRLMFEPLETFSLGSTPAAREPFTPLFDSRFLCLYSEVLQVLEDVFSRLSEEFLIREL